MVLKTVAFDEIGLPGSVFLCDDIKYYSRTQHTNMDLYDHIQEDDLKQAAEQGIGREYNSAGRMLASMA